jgi:hypothetical protein
MTRIASALRASAGDAPLKPTPQSERLVALEETVAVMQQTLDVQFKRMAAMQAEIDHLTARKPENVRSARDDG